MCPLARRLVQDREAVMTGLAIDQAVENRVRRGLVHEAPAFPIDDHEPPGQIGIRQTAEIRCQDGAAPVVASDRGADRAPHRETVAPVMRSAEIADPLTVHAYRRIVLAEQCAIPANAAARHDHCTGPHLRIAGPDTDHLSLVVAHEPGHPRPQHRLDTLRGGRLLEPLEQRKTGAFCHVAAGTLSTPAQYSFSGRNSTPKSINHSTTAAESSASRRARYGSRFH